ncbi:MAG: DUF1418 family protein [Gammaproteobacteria bacterium]|nr:DUF1418 family protein [Gammaproteobacteria bacterium]
MPKNFSALFPMRLLILDLLGFVLACIGVTEWLTQAGFVPELLRFKYHDLLLIAAGVTLMLPLLVNIIVELRTPADSREQP